MPRGVFLPHLHVRVPGRSCGRSRRSGGGDGRRERRRRADRLLRRGWGATISVGSINGSSEIITRLNYSADVQSIPNSWGTTFGGIGRSAAGRIIGGVLGAVIPSELGNGELSTPLYRAVDRIELRSIFRSGGRFMPSPFGSEGKYFAVTEQGARWEGAALENHPGFNGPSTVVGTTYPGEIGATFEDATPYGRVPSVFVLNSDLHRLSPAYVLP